MLDKPAPTFDIEILLQTTCPFLKIGGFVYYDMPVNAGEKGKLTWYDVSP